MGARHNQQCDLASLLSSTVVKTEMLNVKEGRGGGVCPDARQLGSAIFQFSLPVSPVSGKMGCCWQDKVLFQNPEPLSGVVGCYPAHREELTTTTPTSRESRTQLCFQRFKLLWHMYNHDRFRNTIRVV